MKQTQIYNRVTAMVILVSIIAMAFYWITVIGDSDSIPVRKQVNLKEGWYYLDCAGEKQPIELPCRIDTENTLQLFYDGREKLKTGDVISTYGAVYDVEIYAGTKCIYCFQDNGREINNAVRGNIVCSGEVPAGTSSEDISLFYHSNSGKYNLPVIVISTENALIKSVFMKSLFYILISIAMVIIGVLALGFGCIMKMQKKFDGRIFCIGVFLVFCGFWCFSDTAFIHMLADYSESVFALDFYLFMIMPIPLAYFVLCTGNMNMHKIIRWIPFLYYFNIIMQSFLVATGTVTFFRMLYITHILMMMAGVLCSLFILLKEYRRKKDSGVLLSIQVLSAVGILGIVAVLLYNFLGYSAYQMVYQTGLLLLMTVLLSVLLKEFSQSVRNRREAIIYKQLSEQDKLTTLDNRRSFDSLLARMEHGLINFENAALLFMDVNFLKKANDTYGHEFGDQLIRGAAECIKHAYGGSGYCYRIGGDEFCAVLFDPSNTLESLKAQVEEEIEDFNKKYKLSLNLSIAIGCSFLIEDGKKKSISEWKTEADNRMYEEKKRIKAQRKI